MFAFRVGWDHVMLCSINMQPAFLNAQHICWQDMCELPVFAGSPCVCQYSTW